MNTLLSLSLLALFVAAHDGDHDDGDYHEDLVEPFPPRSWLTKPLICNCTLGASKFCQPQGTCDAHLVAATLKSGLRNAHQLIETVSNHDAVLRQLLDRVCSAMSKVDVVTDIQILDFDNWEPACVSYSDGRQMCALGPSGESSVDVGRLNGMISKFYSYLQCDTEQYPPALLSSDWDLCHHDYCNSETATPEAQGLHGHFAHSEIVIPLAAAVGALLLITVVVIAVGTVLRSRRSPGTTRMFAGKSLQV